jgi:hypothetical protein
MSDLTDAEDAVNAASVILQAAADASTSANAATVLLQVQAAQAIVDGEEAAVLIQSTISSNQVLMAASVTSMAASIVTFATP